MGYKIFYNKIKYLVFGLIIAINSSCIFYSFKNISPSSDGSKALESRKATLKPECKNTLIVKNCFKSSVETGLERSKIEIFVEGFGKTTIDVSDTCIYGVAAIDVRYRITAVLPRPKINVICALPES
tara:strand:+ start:511 stop:891 length:381 start_codon:yes stop_codon:yes gene_type:complete